MENEEGEIIDRYVSTEFLRHLHPIQFETSFSAVMPPASAAPLTASSSRPTVTPPSRSPSARLTAIAAPARTSYALCGFSHARGEGDDSLNRLCQRDGYIRNVWTAPAASDKFCLEVDIIFFAM
ncbi:hypothetical protein KXV68_002083, partial [Aspergillus fumigatus]